MIYILIFITGNVFEKKKKRLQSFKALQNLTCIFLFLKTLRLSSHSYQRFRIMSNFINNKELKKYSVEVGRGQLSPPPPHTYFFVSFHGVFVLFSFFPFWNAVFLLVVVFVACRVTEISGNLKNVIVTASYSHIMFLKFPPISSEAGLNLWKSIKTLFCLKAWDSHNCYLVYFLYTIYLFVQSLLLFLGKGEE